MEKRKERRVGQKRLVKVNAQCSHPGGFFRLSTRLLGGWSPMKGRRDPCSRELGTVVLYQLLLNPDVLDATKTKKERFASGRGRLSFRHSKHVSKKQHPAAISSSPHTSPHGKFQTHCKLRSTHRGMRCKSAHLWFSRPSTIKRFAAHPSRTEAKKSSRPCEVGLCHWGWEYNIALYHCAHGFVIHEWVRVRTDCILITKSNLNTV